jgi:hypothetical protein
MYSMRLAPLRHGFAALQCRANERRAEARTGHRRKASIMNTMPGCSAFPVVASKSPLLAAATIKRWTLAWLAAALLASGAAVAAPILTASRTLIDFGNVSFGVPIGAQSFVIANAGDAPLALEGFLQVGSDKFVVGGPCNAVFTLAAGASCRFDITLALTSQYVGPIAARFQVDSDHGGSVEVQLRAVQVAGTGVPTTVVVVEYYNAVLDHYFITWVAAEQANLDAGNTPTRWTRTGFSFRAFTTAQAGTSPVCRYYIPPGLGDSHFFGRGTAECDATGQHHPSFVLESSDFMHIYLPVAGVCPSGTIQVYRVFSNRPDANHRYMIDRTVRDGMVAGGWLAEGDGPDLVVMCAPV